MPQRQMKENKYGVVVYLIYLSLYSPRGMSQLENYKSMNRKKLEKGGVKLLYIVLY